MPDTHSKIDMIRMIKYATGMNLLDTKNTVEKIIESWRDNNDTHLMSEKSRLVVKIEEINQEIHDLEIYRNTIQRELDEVLENIIYKNKQLSDDMNKLQSWIISKMIP